MCLDILVGTLFLCLFFLFICIQCRTHDNSFVLVFYLMDSLSLYLPSFCEKLLFLQCVGVNKIMQNIHVTSYKD